MLKAEPFTAAEISAVGVGRNAEGWPSLDVGPDQTAQIRAFITASPSTEKPASQDVTFRIFDQTSGETATARDHFFSR